MQIHNLSLKQLYTQCIVVHSAESQEQPFVRLEKQLMWLSM